MFLLIDFSNLVYFDSAGLSALVTEIRRAYRNGTQVMIRGGGPTLTQVLQDEGIDNFADAGQKPRPPFTTNYELSKLGSPGRKSGRQPAKVLWTYE